MTASSTGQSAEGAGEAGTGDPPARVREYVVAVAAVILAYGARGALAGVPGLSTPDIVLYPAAVAAAWYGGLGPGLAATALGVLAAAPPIGQMGGAASRPADWPFLFVFAATGSAIAWLGERLRRSEGARRTAVESAEARAERLDAILNTTVDGVVVINDHGLIEAFNGGAERLFGYAAADVLGRNVSLLMPPPDRDAHDGYIERYLRTGEAHIVGIGREVTGLRRDGSLVPLHLAVGEMRIGGQRKFTGLLHDLTKRAALTSRLQASEARWRAVIDAAVDGIIVIDTRGRIEAFNHAAERLFGYAESEVLGRNVRLLMPSPYREEHDGYMAAYLATGHAKIIGIGREVPAVRRDGSTFPIHLSVGELSVGGERKFTGILHDLTNRTQMEAQLREQATLVRLGEMAAVLAHEVKNPLAGIRGAIQVVGTRMPQDHASLPILKEIVARIDSLDAMMKDLLLYARPPKPRVQSMDVVPLVRTTVALLSQDPMLKDVQIHLDGSAPSVAVDADMLKIVFQNLLINSAHAMQGQGAVRIEVTSDGKSCRLTFADSGPGIPADVRDKVFVPFFTTKSRGTGLGLPTVKRLIEAHGGDVSIDCPAGGGTVVTLRVPLSPPVEQEAGQKSAP